VQGACCRPACCSSKAHREIGDDGGGGRLADAAAHPGVRVVLRRRPIRYRVALGIDFQVFVQDAR